MSIFECFPRETPEHRKRREQYELRHPKEPFDPDPILISLVRRAMPNLIGYEICGVQPMAGPTGLIYTMPKPDYRRRIKENIEMMRQTGRSTRLLNANAWKPIRGQQLDISKQINSIEFTGKS